MMIAKLFIVTMCFVQLLGLVFLDSSKQEFSNIIRLIQGIFAVFGFLAFANIMGWL